MDIPPVVDLGVIAFVLGVIAGGVIDYLYREITTNKFAEYFKELKTVGTLRLDQSDPVDGPYLFLELNRPIENVVAEEKVVLDVNVEDYASQE